MFPLLLLDYLFPHFYQFLHCVIWQKRKTTRYIFIIYKAFCLHFSVQCQQINCVDYILMSILWVRKRQCRPFTQVINMKTQSRCWSSSPPRPASQTQTLEPMIWLQTKLQASQIQTCPAETIWIAGPQSHKLNSRLLF